MRVLVTGASGFLGRRVAALLARSGHRVHCLDARECEGPRYGCTCTVCDLTDHARMAGLLPGGTWDAAVHLAGVRGDPSAMKSVNVDGTAGLAGVLAGRTGRLLVSSSCAVYGIPESPDGAVSETCPTDPVTGYGRSMLEREAVSASSAARHGIEVTMLRFFNVFGPGQEPVMLAPEAARGLARIAAGIDDPPLRTGPLDTRRDMIDVGDAAAAVFALLERPAAGPVNVGTGVARSGREVVDALMDAMGISVGIIEERRTGSPVPVIAADTSLLRSATGWSPVVAFEDTIAALADYWSDRL